MSYRCLCFTLVLFPFSLAGKLCYCITMAGPFQFLKGDNEIIKAGRIGGLDNWRAFIIITIINIINFSTE